MKNQPRNFIIFGMLIVSSFTTSIGFAREIEAASTFDLNDYKGQTYLNFMRNHIKPAMDVLATDGYEVCGAAAIETAYEKSDRKVQGKVDRDFGGLAKVKEIAAALEGQTVTLNDLPGKIAAVDRAADRYDLATFIGMACGGGVKIRYNDENYGLNVHYDTTEQRSGRSFGVGPTRGANDASDKNYLEDLQDYARTSKTDLPDFFTALFGALLNSDASAYAEIKPEGQTVLTDFLSVFTAEQARNLMDNEVAPHWDAALLEVTLLSAFHAGQSEIKLFYYDPNTRETTFADTTYKQTPCQAPSREVQAHMRDYWQFSRNITDPANCKRSGINITKKEFRKLGTLITTYVYDNHREVYDNVIATVGGGRDSDNLYQTLSSFLISESSPESLSAAKVRAATKAWVEFLKVTTKDAAAITTAIENQ